MLVRNFERVLFPVFLVRLRVLAFPEDEAALRVPIGGGTDEELAVRVPNEGLSGTFFDLGDTAGLEPPMDS